MAFQTGRFGVQYHPRGGEESHLLRWLVTVVVALVLVSFVCDRITKSLGNRPETREKNRVTAVPKPAVPKPDVAKPPAVRGPVRTAASGPAVQPKAAPKPEVVRSVAEDRPSPPVPTPDANGARPATPKPPAPPVRPVPELPRTAQELIDKINATIETRSNNEQVQLRRLMDAERQGRPEIAVDTIRRIYARPAFADLSDLLMRRWGDLNMALLFSGTDKPTPWTTVATVRRGDGLERIAREHRTTPAVIARLNPQRKWERLKPGDTVRVLNFPSATLVVHRGGYADLALNKNEPFFRRYDLTVSDTAKSGVYPVEAGSPARTRFRELGVRFKPTSSDRAELEMFLAPGSRIIVSSDK